MNFHVHNGLVFFVWSTGCDHHIPGALARFVTEGIRLSPYSLIFQLWIKTYKSFICIQKTFFLPVTMIPVSMDSFYPLLLIYVGILPQKPSIHYKLGPNRRRMYEVYHGNCWVKYERYIHIRSLSNQYKWKWNSWSNCKVSPWNK